MTRPASQRVASLALLQALLLGSGCGMHSISGTVVDETGKGIPGCAVAMRMGGPVAMGPRGETNAQGEFSLGSATFSGRCSISFVKQGYEGLESGCPVDNKPLRIVLRAVNSAAAPQGSPSPSPSPSPVKK